VQKRQNTGGGGDPKTGGGEGIVVGRRGARGPRKTGGLGQQRNKCHNRNKKRVNKGEICSQKGCEMGGEFMQRKKNKREGRSGKGPGKEVEEKSPYWEGNGNSVEDVKTTKGKSTERLKVPRKAWGGPRRVRVGRRKKMDEDLGRTLKKKCCDLGEKNAGRGDLALAGNRRR